MLRYLAPFDVLARAVDHAAPSAIVTIPHNGLHLTSVVAMDARPSGAPYHYVLATFVSPVVTPAFAREVNLFPQSLPGRIAKMRAARAGKDAA